MDISSDVIRGYNDTIILSILQNAPSYGYEISKQIRKISDEKYVIKETTLYSAFTRMDKKGYIESYPGNETNGKKRTYYQITEIGKKYFEEKCEEWKLTKDVIDRFVGTKLLVRTEFYGDGSSGMQDISSSNGSYGVNNDVSGSTSHDVSSSAGNLAVDGSAQQQKEGRM